MIDGFWVLKENNFEPTFLCSIKLSKYIRYEGRTKTFQMCEDSEILSIIVLSLKVAAAKLLQSCLTLCDPMDCSSPGFSIHGILQARTLERVAISFSNAWKWKVKVKSLSHVRLFATHGLKPTRLLHPWNFLGKSTGVGCHFLLQGIFPTQGSNPGLPHSRQIPYQLSRKVGWA